MRLENATNLPQVPEKLVISKGRTGALAVRRTVTARCFILSGSLIESVV